jgi:hypothetical protein
MALLQVRDCPAEIYKTLARCAESENRSIAQQTVVLLRNELSLPSAKRERRLNALRQTAELHFTPGSTIPSPAELIRQDRDR